uniref:Uncharacterized protein n=1 Tax=Chromera velia CCMP2878 TaxID=1169474 RepID=A0A0G4HE17_9ALVE|mmetsp:Transcript_30043/g.58982  ORF Transcript_30043/g.58982 Transcript_30043/m.58982 type:complete len:198 (+) Transcript_30043:243-836(+)|eukprot:Cvel_981.t1-p1 / transcript=Cvel_981.t1 / gene=Cvel_981 / organism=Chromera_velia_CCMP2878 / gene_product=hypothetical protein / transcript_product=hypothetical protein / location=Cvel_scaffold31:160575-161165(+) / protein_length=197 / sequence_SO=supercontig / SO=protein_coding / is_pseudo=false
MLLSRGGAIRRGLAGPVASLRSFSSSTPSALRVYPNPFSIFGTKSMVMFRPLPSLFSSSEENVFMSRDQGRLMVSVMQREAPPKLTYDKKSKVTLALGGAEVGMILAADPTDSGMSVQIERAESMFSISKAKDSENGIVFKMEKKGNAASAVEVEAVVGDLVCLQSLLQSLLPTLYGWQVVSNPLLLPYFTKPPEQS